MLYGRLARGKTLVSVTKFDATGRATRNTWRNGVEHVGERPMEYWSLADIRADPRNPWKHGEELETHGFGA
jgi:hypothetical protein